MLNKAQEWAISEINRDKGTIEELKAERRIAWKKKDMRTCRELTRDIRDLNQGIRNLVESYGVRV